MEPYDILRRPTDLSDDKINRIDEGDYIDAAKIGELRGCLVLCRQMLAEGEDPLEICDDIAGDLEYTISALSDVAGPLNEESGDPEQDVYYIHDFQMESEYDDALLKSRILEELPNLVFVFLHVAPDILAFYPAPLEYNPDPVQEERYRILQSIAAEKVASALDQIIGEKDAEQACGNVVKFADIYHFSDDELKCAMGRRHSGSSYPTEAKDKKEYNFYELNGFEEVGDSRLLYKYVGL